MIDTHTHLDFPEFDQDREEVIRRAFDNGIKAIVNIGVDLERSRKSIELAEKHERIFAAVGFHPDFFSKGDLGNQGDWKDWVEKLKKLAKCKKVVAIGETGLDYFHITHSMEHGTKDLEKIKENQRRGFLAQIEIAKELGLPVIVHCRNAWDDLYEIISKVRLFPSDKQVVGIPQSRTLFVLHCYSGEKKDTEKFLKLPNVYFSFSGNITYPKPADRAEKLAEAVRMIPLDKMMLDSDAPFLAPQEFRGKRNEPMYVKFIAEKIARVKEISVEEVERVTDGNAMKFFWDKKLGRT